jgi:hypothetical protein
LQLEIAKEVVSRLEMALAHHEESLCQRLKLKSLALSSLPRTIAHQESRLIWLKEGNTPTKFFHIHANARRRKKFIGTLEHVGQILVTKESKAHAFFDFFDDVLGTPPLRMSSMDLQCLGLPRANLSQLNE